MADGPVLVVLAAGRARRYGGVKPLAPVGPGGEAVIDLLAGDALAAGFSTIVLVVGPATGPAIRYHVEHTWPASVDVRFALQEAPLGTVHAVLASAGHLGDGRSVRRGQRRRPLRPRRAGPAGPPPRRRHRRAQQRPGGLPAAQRRGGRRPGDPGVCEVGADGMLRSIVERRQVAARADGRFVAGDGLDPAELDGDTLVSMNLWGFGPEMLDVMADAMEADRGGSEEAEVLLPEVVGAVLAGRRAGGVAQRFRVLAAEGRCIGVTHPDDLCLVQSDLAGQVGRGERPAVALDGRGGEDAGPTRR